jgi:hypothetical protein
MRLTIAATCLLSLLLAAPVSAQSGITISAAEEPTPPTPGVGGDAVLPAGFQQIRWGATAEILMGVRGGMERQPQAFSDISLYIEQAAPGEGRRDIIHYKLWRDQAYEVKIHYQDLLSGPEAHQFLRRVQDVYGEAKHSVGRADRGQKGAGGVKVESWQWEDPFTIQVLLRDAVSNEWSMLRRSKVLADVRVRQEARDVVTNQDHKINKIPID